jgi:hypothetical protein
MTGPENSPQKKDSKPDNLLNYFKVHIRETITYILLVIGIILMFFDQLYGGILVGLIAGIYFGDEIVNFIKSWSTTTDSKKVARNLILAGIAIAFFISAPAIYLGAAISIAVKQLFVGAND